MRFVTSLARFLRNTNTKIVLDRSIVRGRKSKSIDMASRASKIAAVAREIFGTLPNRGVRTGLQFLKKPLTGAYEARYYMEPIEPFARKVRRATKIQFYCVKLS
jgi:hypothetical protein